LKNKPADIPYCGVDPQKISQAAPVVDLQVFALWKRWVYERYQIHLKKDVHRLPRPWTDWEVLQTNRFTNVRREHDRETKWLIERISQNPDLSYREKLLNSILFRIWNKSQTFEIFGGPWKEEDLYECFLLKDRCREIAKNIKDYVWFTNAFNTGGTKYANQFPFKSRYGHSREVQHEPHFEPCMEVRPFHIAYRALREAILTGLLETSSPKAHFDLLLELPGIAGFLGYQIFVDFTYIDEYPFSENEFVISGPGCSRGLSVLFSDKKGLSDEELIFWIRDRQKDLGFLTTVWYSDLPLEERFMSVMSIENQMCELSKVVKLVQGTGRARNSFEGTPGQKRRTLF